MPFGLPDAPNPGQLLQGIGVNVNIGEQIKKVTHQESDTEKKHDKANEKKIDALVHDGKGPLTKKEELLKKSFDKNHDGKFSDEEVKEAAKALGKKLSEFSTGHAATSHQVASVNSGRDGRS